MLGGAGRLELTILRCGGSAVQGKNERGTISWRLGRDEADKWKKEELSEHGGGFGCMHASLARTKSMSNIVWLVYLFYFIYIVD